MWKTKDHRVSDMKITTPPLIKMRSVVSDDGNSVRFFLLFQTGQNSSFSLPFNKIGLFFGAIKNVVDTMGRRIAARGGSDAAEVSQGLADAVTVKAVASGRDAETGDTLLWIETEDGGPFAFRLTGETAEMLTEALREDEDPRRQRRRPDACKERPPEGGLTPAKRRAARRRPKSMAYTASRNGKFRERRIHIGERAFRLQGGFLAVCQRGL